MDGCTAAPREDYERSTMSHILTLVCSCYLNVSLYFGSHYETQIFPTDTEIVSLLCIFMPPAILSSVLTRSHRLRRAGVDRHPSNFCCICTSVVGGKNANF
jgi:hypothetical protein